MHYYQHHIGDYNRDTAALSMTEHGAYRTLMDAYYVTERPLPTDDASLFRICRAMSKVEKDAVHMVISLFFTKHEDGYTHKRIKSEIEIYRSQVETASRAGKASAASRQRKRNDRSTTVQRPLEFRSNGNATPLPTKTQPTMNHDPETNDHTHTGPGFGQGVEFPSWYPATAEKAIAMCQTIGGVPEDFIRSVWAQCAGREFKDGAGREVTRFALYIAARWPKEKATWGQKQFASTKLVTGVIPSKTPKSF